MNPSIIKTDSSSSKSDPSHLHHHHLHHHHHHHHLHHHSLNSSSPSSSINLSGSNDESKVNNPSSSLGNPAPHIRKSIHVRPSTYGRRRRHTISNNHIEFVFYHCLRDDIDEEDEVGGDEEQDEDEDEDEDSSYHRLSSRRQDQSLFDLHHCDVIVLKTDNGWCFDQDIFLPAWKRDAYEAAGQDDGFTSQELVKVDEIRLD
ncbi:hypothetical protein O181_084236 [Austropuccinia psidii MF-1]|uniref:Uncharacterized protein n=1 Tax=Austropuccinia psidii MF-1 TaxID=1389203 RepID=A0A9Q3FW45_9BASI|nr:hypothetical protein [Austropuccinia psidii MF-1]